MHVHVVRFKRNLTWSRPAATQPLNVLLRLTGVGQFRISGPVIWPFCSACGNAAPANLSRRGRLAAVKIDVRHAHLPGVYPAPVSSRLWKAQLPPPLPPRRAGERRMLDVIAMGAVVITAIGSGPGPGGREQVGAPKNGMTVSSPNRGSGRPHPGGRVHPVGRAWTPVRPCLLRADMNIFSDQAHRLPFGGLFEQVVSHQRGSWVLGAGSGWH